MNNFAAQCATESHHYVSLIIGLVLGLVIGMVIR